MERIEVFRGGSRLVEFVAAPRFTGPEFVVDPEGWSGWPAPSVKREAVQRQAAHGSYQLPTFYGDSSMMVTGHALASTGRELAFMRREIMRCYPDNVRVQVTDDFGTLWANASLTSAPVFNTLPDGRERTAARFEIEFWLPEPWKFGKQIRTPASGFASAVTVVNRGEETAWPVVRVQGPTSGVTIRANGRVKILTVSLTSSQWVELDTRTDIAITSTGQRLTTGSSGLPPYLLPGVNTVSFEGASGAVTFAETFI